MPKTVPQSGKKQREKTSFTSVGMKANLLDKYGGVIGKASVLRPAKRKDEVVVQVTQVHKPPSQDTATSRKLMLIGARIYALNEENRRLTYEWQVKMQENPSLYFQKGPSLSPEKTRELQNLMADQTALTGSQRNRPVKTSSIMAVPLDRLAFASRQIPKTQFVSAATRKQQSREGIVKYFKSLRVNPKRMIRMLKRRGINPQGRV